MSINADRLSIVLCKSQNIKHPLSLMKKTLNVLQNDRCFYTTNPKALSCLMLIVFYLLVVTLHLLSLRLNKNSSIMAVKSFNLCIALFSYVITICINNTSILKTLIVKSGDTEVNPGPTKLSAIKCQYWNLNGQGGHDLQRYL